MKESDRIFKALSDALKLRGKIEDRRGGGPAAAIAYNETHRLIAEWRKAKAKEGTDAKSTS